MKLIMNLLSVLSIIGLLSTLICGIWMKQQASIDPSSIKFHMTLGSASIAITIIVLALFMLKK